MMDYIQQALARRDAEPQPACSFLTIAEELIRAELVTQGMSAEKAESTRGGYHDAFGVAITTHENDAGPKIGGFMDRKKAKYTLTLTVRPASPTRDPADDEAFTKLCNTLGLPHTESPSWGVWEVHSRHFATLGDLRSHLASHLSPGNASLLPPVVEEAKVASLAV